MNPCTLRNARTLMGRLPYGADLLTTLNELCSREGVALGEVNAIGAISRGRFGYYDQEAREYRFLEKNEHLEIVSLAGNISIKDGKPFVHAHIALSDSNGRVYGGHLVEGNIIFACEYIVKEFTAPDTSIYERTLDSQTGLYLWQKQSLSG